VEGGLAQAATPSSAVNSRAHERILCTGKLTDLVGSVLDLEFTPRYQIHTD
jgi:hypothetical protein